MNRDDLVTEVRATAEQLLDNAKESIEEKGYFDPVCAVLYPDGRKEFLYPRYKNQDQKEEAFEAMNKHIKDTAAEAAVLVLDSHFTPKPSVDLPRSESLVVTKRAFGFREFEAHLYSKGEDEVEWTHVIGPSEQYKDWWLTVFEEVH